MRPPLGILLVMAVLIAGLTARAASVPTRGVVLETNIVASLSTNDMLIWSGSRWITVNRSELGSGGGGSGTVTNVALETTVGGLGVTGSPIQTGGTITITGIVSIAGGGTGTNTAEGARTALGLGTAATNAASAFAAASHAHSGSDITSGTVADARIDSALARDSEVTAVAATLEPLNSGKYQGTNANLTTLAALNGAALTTLNGSAIASGTVADARIDSALARDSEVTAVAATLEPLNSGKYQGTNANLTTLAALNGAALTSLNGSAIASGTVADARIDSALARDSEVTAVAATLEPLNAGKYQGTNANLTALGALNGAGLTNVPFVTRTITRFTAAQSQPPAANYATFSTRNSIGMLQFDPTTQKSANFVWSVPDSYAGSAVTVILHCASTATSGNYRFGAKIARLTGVDIDSPDTYATDVEATTATSGTAGLVTTLTLSGVGLDSAVAGDFVQLNVYRDTGDGADTVNSNDILLFGVEVRAE